MGPMTSLHPETRRFASSSHPHSVPEHIAQLVYSRSDLMKMWHAASRAGGPGDVQFESRSHLRGNCTVVHADGTVDTMTELSKQDLIDNFGIQPRDLRSLDAHILDVRPSLLVCKRSVILCTPINRAIISHDRLILVGSDPANPLVTRDEALEMAESIKSVMKYLASVAEADPKNGSKRTFEFRALEAMLLLTVRGFKIVVADMQERVYEVIPQLRYGVSPAELRDLLESKRIVDDCLFAGRAMQSAIATVLSEDEDLVGMYLTDKAKGVARPIQDHQNAELLLEYCAVTSLGSQPAWRAAAENAMCLLDERRLDETNESSVRLASLLSDIDSNLSLTLASTRVRLQNLELQTAITTLALAAGTALAGFFGMNLISGYEDHPLAFYYATSTAVAWMGVIMVIGYVRLFRARRSQLFMGRSVLKHPDGLNGKGRLGGPRGRVDEQPLSTERNDLLRQHRGAAAKAPTVQTPVPKAAKSEEKNEAREEKKDGSEL